MTKKQRLTLIASIVILSMLTIFTHEFGVFSGIFLTVLFFALLMIVAPFLEKLFQWVDKGTSKPKEKNIIPKYTITQKELEAALSFAVENSITEFNTIVIMLVESNGFSTRVYVSAEVKGPFIDITDYGAW